jgi:uncharacterized protein YjiS (DUF1127 family)
MALLHGSFKSIVMRGLRTAIAAITAGAKAARRIAQALTRRADIAALANFDDRMLADIGLTRSDVRDAIAEPLWRDPSGLLASRVLERRMYRPQTLPLPGLVSRLNAPPRVPAAGPLSRKEAA